MSLYSETNPRFITTIDDGWLVAIRTAKAGRLVTKTFRPQSDEMLVSAINWRNRAYRRLFKKPVPERVFHTAKKETLTGIPGVRYQLKKMKTKRGRRYEMPLIIAEIYTIPGKDYERPKGGKSRVFSLNKYDWDEAIDLAVTWRNFMIAKLEKTPLVN